MKFFISFICLIAVSLISIHSNQAFCEVSKRIDAIEFDVTEIKKIFLENGRISLVRFPYSVEEAHIGDSKNFSVNFSSKFKKEMVLQTYSPLEIKTNLIVRDSTGKVYVFDLYSKKHSHNDYLSIDEIYGSVEVTKRKPKKTINYPIRIYDGKKKFIAKGEGL